MWARCANETRCLCSLPVVDARRFTNRLPWPPATLLVSDYPSRPTPLVLPSVSQCTQFDSCHASQWERLIFAPPPLRNRSTNSDVMSNILLGPPRELMRKIWLGSIRPCPLRICTFVKKARFVLIFFINVSICLSVKPFLRRGYRPQFCGNFNAKWLKRRDFATISAFLWSH